MVSYFGCEGSFQMAIPHGSAWIRSAIKNVLVEPRPESPIEGQSCCIDTEECESRRAHNRAANNEKSQEVEGVLREDCPWPRPLRERDR